MILRDYQISMIDDIREKMVKSKAMLCCLPTGAGKTALASEMIKRINNKGNVVYFLVHRKDLVSQTSNVFKDFGIEHSFIAAGHGSYKKSFVFICSIETLKRRMKRCAIPKVVFVDECHLAASKGWSEVIQFYKENGCYIIGLTATPWRLDSKGLGCLFDEIVYGPTISELIERGHLSKYKYYAPSHPDLSGIHMVAGDYNKKELSSFMEKEKKIIGSAIEHYKKYANGLRVVCYCCSIVHSQKVAEDFCNAGIPAIHIDGKSSKEERTRAAIALADGTVNVVCNVDLITTGYDLASQSGKDVTIEGIILLRPTKSLSLYLQMIGRGLRKKDNPAIILDHASNVLEHGLPCDEREWSLADREKGIGGKKGEKLLPVKECDKCHYCHKPAPQCPNCGRVYEVQSRTIEEVDGELAEVDAAAMRKKMEARRQVGRAKSIDELEAIARERGYRSGWVQIQAKLRGLAS